MAEIEVQTMVEQSSRVVAVISDSDPSAFVKASVPGTTEAKDAVLLASLPSTATVDVSQPTTLQVQYNGDPKLQAIPDTRVQYAANSPNAVFLVDGGYYRGAQVYGP